MSAALKYAPSPQSSDGAQATAPPTPANDNCQVSVKNGSANLATGISYHPSGAAAGNIWNTYTHDARGNVTGNGVNTFVYDHANQPVSVSGGASGAYVYDGNLKRVKQDVDGEKIYSAYSSLGGGITHRYNFTTMETTDYVALGGTTMRLTNGTNPVYTHSDHQGNPVAATDTSGAILWREAYTPFGEKLLDPTANRDLSGYTGHIADDATNLVYMQARYYDGAIGRFLSIDPVDIVDIGDTRYFNRYAYTGNDPINNIDSDGRCFGPAILPCIWAAFAGGGTATVSTTTVVAGATLAACAVGCDDIVEVATGTSDGTIIGDNVVSHMFEDKSQSGLHSTDLIESDLLGTTFTNDNSGAGPNDRHGDGGRSEEKTSGQIADLETLAGTQTGRERKKTLQKIKNIKKANDKAKKGEEHHRGKKR